MRVNAYEAQRLALAQRIVGHLDAFAHHYVTGFLTVVVFAALAAAAMALNRPVVVTKPTTSTSCIAIPAATPARVTL